MADDKKDKKSTVGHAVNFYFAPELRSVFTVFFFTIYGYFTIYYLDNILVAIRFLIYVISSHTALQGTEYLFTGMAFVISLALPFAISVYTIFLLPGIWKKTDWSTFAKWAVTLSVIISGVICITFSDSAARYAARKPIMQSFVEDANLTGRI